MSTLATATIARYSAQRLLELTNPENPNASSRNDTLLEQAVTDATAEFATLVQETLDTSDTAHLRVATALVVLLLMEWGSAPASGAAKFREQVEKMATALKMVTSRDRILPQTKSVLTPTSEQRVANETVRPDFDLAEFDDILPGTTFYDDDD